MIRAAMGDQEHWDKWTQYSAARLKKMLALLAATSLNPVYDPQYALDAAIMHLRLTIELYSRGDPIAGLEKNFAGLLDTWELSNRLADQVCMEHKLGNCRDWKFSLTSLNHYNWCFWLIGLALAFELSCDQWDRLIALIGGEGEDKLLDQVIATRQPKRSIGLKLLHPKPYQRLLLAIDAPKPQQPSLLLDFVDNWYPELARMGEDELWWYIYGDPVKHPLEMGSYFGRWCIEAVAAVKAFSLDDSLCLGHEHYPGDLLRPDGPTTHPQREQEEKSVLARLFGKKRF